jgi:hypothetical protein
LTSTAAAAQHSPQQQLGLTAAVWQQLLHLQRFATRSQSEVAAEMLLQI